MSKAAKRERQRQNREVRREVEAQIARRRKTFRAARSFGIVLVPVIVAGVVISLTRSSDSTRAEARPIDRTYDAAPAMTIDPAKIYSATVSTSEGAFTIQLDPKHAPQTVNSFVFLARKRFFDGLTFHRIAKDFVIQGGDPAGNGTGGPGYSLPDEPPPDGYSQYSVAMANSGPGTSGSQFFVVTTASGATALGGPPYAYSTLGQVIGGFPTVERLNKLGSTAQDPGQQEPNRKVTIRSVRITETEPDPSTTTTTAAP